MTRRNFTEHQFVRFPFERRRYGWFIETRWFWLRIYPPTLPRWTFARKR